MGSTELGVGILLVCVSVAIAAVWGSDGDDVAAAGGMASQQEAASDAGAGAGSVAGDSVAP